MGERTGKAEDGMMALGAGQGGGLKRMSAGEVTGVLAKGPQQSVALGVSVLEGGLTDFGDADLNDVKALTEVLRRLGDHGTEGLTSGRVEGLLLKFAADGDNWLKSGPREWLFNEVADGLSDVLLTGKGDLSEWDGHATAVFGMLCDGWPHLGAGDPRHAVVCERALRLAANDGGWSGRAAGVTLQRSFMLPKKIRESLQARVIKMAAAGETGLIAAAMDSVFFEGMAAEEVWALLGEWSDTKGAGCSGDWAGLPFFTEWGGDTKSMHASLGFNRAIGRSRWECLADWAKSGTGFPNGSKSPLPEWARLHSSLTQAGRVKEADQAAMWADAVAGCEALGFPVSKMPARERMRVCSEAADSMSKKSMAAAAATVGEGMKKGEWLKVLDGFGITLAGLGGAGAGMEVAWEPKARRVITELLKKTGGEMGSVATRGMTLFSVAMAAEMEDFALGLRIGEAKGKGRGPGRGGKRTASL